MNSSLSFRALAVILMAALLTISCASQTPPASPEGSWQGTLGAGSVKLRIVLTFTRTSSGEWQGVLESLDQGATIPAEKVTLSGDKVRVDIPRVNGFYEGAISQDGASITGTWTQNNTGQPLNFKRVESNQQPPKPEAGAAAAPAAPPQKPLTAPVDVTIPIEPTAVKADGKMHLVYELHISNYSGQNVALTRVEALGDSGAVLSKTEGALLAANVLIPGNRQATGLDKLNLAGGQFAVIYMWVTFDSPEKVPARLEHRLAMKVGKYPDEITVQCARLSVGRDPVVIDAPLRGDRWVAGNGPSNTSGHRRTLLPIDGRAYIAQRFAIDWVRVNPEGKTFKGDDKDNKNYLAYGVDALAVADGVVTEVKDGIPENIPGENSRAVPITLETVGGNHVILDLGHGRYAFYAHLQPGSLKVKTGDHVKRGQALGLVGNSGNSTEPHLHFHLGNTNSPLGTEGIPYVLRSFTTTAKKDAPAVAHSMEIPLEDEIVTFAEPK